MGFMAGTMGSGITRFDLHELARLNTRQWSKRRLVDYWFGTLGMALFAAAAILVLVRANSWNPLSMVESVAISLIGLIILALAIRHASQSRSLPNSVSVSDNGISFEFDDSDKKQELKWDDPNFQITLFDRRGMPSLLPNGESRIAFTLLIPSGKRIPLTREAFKAIYEEASAHGFSEVRRTVSGSPEPGSYERLVFAPAPRHHSR
jgi:hypothetical protein